MDWEKKDPESKHASALFSRYTHGYNSRPYTLL